MSRFELLAWMVGAAVMLGLLVGGIVSIIVMIVEVVRRLKARVRRAWTRCLGWREGAATPDDASDPQRG